MKNDNLDEIWVEIESNIDSRRQRLQRLVYVQLLWRVFIGCCGVPSLRFLSIEIPQKKEKEIDVFSTPQGFSLTIDKPVVDHQGYVTCVLQATSSDRNGVFTVLAQDILEELSKQNDAEKYIDTLKSCIAKWRDFFKNQQKKRLSEKEVVGLIGELSFLHDMQKSGLGIISDMWNGPIKSAQDFQGKAVAIEVKTSAANKLDCVHISSEEQLNDNGRKALFLVVYRIEKNDSNGIMLPALIKRVAATLSEHQRMSFYAKLTCLGYSEEDARYYDSGYSLRERKVYLVKEGFPRVLRMNLPQGICDLSYLLSLQNCQNFEIEFELIVRAIKENEYGED